MRTDKIETLVIKVLAEQAGMPVNAISMETTRESLGIDSLAWMWVIIALEGAFVIEINDNSIMKVIVVQDLVDYIVLLVNP